jgi:hypothetical protein
MSRPYRLKKGRISRPEADGKRHLYEPGDIIQMSAEQLDSFNGVLEPVHVAPSKEKEPAKKEKPALAADLVEAIANSDDEAEIQKILDDEEAGPSRKSVVEAATAKLEKLATKDDEEED